MPPTIVVVDADACVPEVLRAPAGLVVAPPEAPLLLEPENVPRLSLEAGRPAPGPVAEACARAAERADAVLYVGAGDAYGQPEGAGQAARHAVEAYAPGRPFAAYDSAAALMGAGWQALAAAEAARDGASLEQSLEAAAAVRERVHVLAMLEHPELATAAGVAELTLEGTRAVVDLHGADVDVLSRIPKRDLALRALRDRFAEQTGGGSGRLHVAIHHAGAGAGAQALATWAERKLVPARLVVAPLTRHAATRLGPRMLGVAWYREPA
ncbi:MAG: hypothetical protein GEU80_03055 [Dehalococcoidia bacterium]|nr:hypothetical protein [Dehalococcoidia bacterium]